MKSYLKLFIAVFFILTVIRTAKADYFSVSGKVRYLDNNEIVTAGIVRAYDVNTCELLCEAQIQPTGDYILPIVRGWQPTDVIGFANNDPEEDWIPTGYPDKTESSQYVHIYPTTNLTGIDIYVIRIPSGSSSPMLSRLSGTILDKNNKPVKDAIVLARLQDQYFGYGITDSKGNYEMKVPSGDYIIIAQKVAHTSASMPVSVNQNGMDNINMVINKNTRENTGQTAPESYRLSQNYPNPFNPSTIISYSIPQGTIVSLKVYNSVGQEVSSPVNEYQQAGNYEIIFSGNNLTSGVYYYQIIAGTFTETKKMTLIK